MTADWALLITVSLLALDAAGPAAVGLVGAVRVLPAALLSAPASVLTDRWSRSRLLALVHAGWAVLAGLLVWCAVADAGLGALLVSGRRRVGAVGGRPARPCRRWCRPWSRRRPGSSPPTRPSPPSRRSAPWSGRGCAPPCSAWSARRACSACSRSCWAPRRWWRRRSVRPSCPCASPPGRRARAWLAPLQGFRVLARPGLRLAITLFLGQTDDARAPERVRGARRHLRRGRVGGAGRPPVHRDGARRAGRCRRGDGPGAAAGEPLDRARHRAVGPPGRGHRGLAVGRAGLGRAGRPRLRERAARRLRLHPGQPAGPRPPGRPGLGRLQRARRRRRRPRLPRRAAAGRRARPGLGDGAHRCGARPQPRASPGRGSGGSTAWPAAGPRTSSCSAASRCSPPCRWWAWSGWRRARGPRTSVPGRSSCARASTRPGSTSSSPATAAVDAGRPGGPPAGPGRRVRRDRPARAGTPDGHGHGDGARRGSSCWTATASSAR